MNCPLCKAEMIEGVVDQGAWVRRTELLKKIQNFGSRANFLIKSVPVIAFRCPKCGKIELDSEVIIKE